MTKPYQTPLLICASEFVYDEHDAAADRAALRSEHERALNAQFAPALLARPGMPSRTALVAAASNPEAKPHPELERFIRLCFAEDPTTKRPRRLTAADIREHGPRAATIVPNLAELIADTAAREKDGR